MATPDDVLPAPDSLNGLIDPRSYCGLEFEPPPKGEKLSPEERERRIRLYTAQAAMEIPLNPNQRIMEGVRYA